jgi:hypothetical protein
MEMDRDIDTDMDRAMDMDTEPNMDTDTHMDIDRDMDMDMNEILHSLKITSEQLKLSERCLKSCNVGQITLELVHIFLLKHP